MGYLPIFVKLDGESVLVVGGGAVATRKAETLLGAGADVTVISPGLSPRLQALKDSGAIRHHGREFEPDDVMGFRLVYAATSDPATNRQVSSAAQAAGVFVNVADSPELCTFIVPALLRRGELQVAVSTGGGSPALARRVRQQLELALGAEYELFLEIMKAAREFLRTTVADPGERMQRLNRLADSNLSDCLRRKDVAGADRIIGELVGPNVNLTTLGFSPGRLQSFKTPSLRQ